MVMCRAIVLFLSALLTVGLVVAVRSCSRNNSVDLEEEEIQGLLTVQCMAISPDGKYLLTGYHLKGTGFSTPGPMPVFVEPKGNKFLALWDLEKETEIRVFRGNFHNVDFVAFLAGGKQAFSVSGNTMRVWDVATGKEIRCIETAGGLSALSPDGKMAVRLLKENRLHLWDVGTGKLIRAFEPCPDPIQLLTFSPDTKMLLSISETTTWRENGIPSAKTNVRWWSLETGETIRIMDWWPGAFSPDGQYVLTEKRRGPPDYKCQLVLWDAGMTKEVRQFQRDTGGLGKAFFTHQGRQILTAGGGMIHLWDVATGEELWYQLFPLKDMVLIPDGKTIVTATDRTNYPGTYSGGIRFDVWDAATGKQLRTIIGRR
jgi:WD40 repeat protein